jgi:serine/threonine-protein kinase RsbT
VAEFEAHVEIASDVDVLAARRRGRELAIEAGFDDTSKTLIATAISELGRNIVTYAGAGRIDVLVVERDGQRGLMVVAADAGPGILDVERAMQDGYSTSGGLGIGLPGSKRLMDEFAISSTEGQGTTVTVTKWVR